MPEILTARIRAWHDALDRLEPGEEDPTFDYGASDAGGIEIAKEVKLSLGDDYYVEYQPFGEISIRDGEPVELDVPRFVSDLTR